MSTFEVEVTSSPSGAHRVVAVLRRHGLDVEWTPPEETRGAGHDATLIVVTWLVTKGLDGAWEKAKAEVAERWPNVGLRRRDPDAEPPPDR
jgi:hypothetical protein